MVFNDLNFNDLKNHKPSSRPLTGQMGSLLCHFQAVLSNLNAFLTFTYFCKRSDGHEYILLVFAKDQTEIKTWQQKLFAATLERSLKNDTS